MHPDMTKEESHETREMLSCFWIWKNLEKSNSVYIWDVVLHSAEAIPSDEATDDMCDAT